MTKNILVGAALIANIGLGPLSAQTLTGGAIRRLDPALDTIVPPNAKLEVLTVDYFGSSEGPVWIPEGPTGYLLFSDQAANRIYKWTPDGELSVFLERAGYTGDPAKWAEVAQLLYNERLYVGLVGTNGLALDSEGRLVMCARGDRAIVRLEKNGTRTTLADRVNVPQLVRLPICPPRFTSRYLSAGVASGPGRLLLEHPPLRHLPATRKQVAV